MQTKLMLAAATLAAAFTTSAYAAKPPAAASTPPPACANTNVVLNAVDCSGFYAGNLVQGAVGADEKAALLDLTPSLLTNIGDAYLVKLDALGGALDLTFTGYQFYGLTYFGIHFGAAKGATMPPGLDSQATAFYVVDFGNTGGNTLHLNYSGSSNIAVYSTKDKPFDVPVPEPATWAMMIIGFGGVGAMVRRRREGLNAA